MNVCRWQPLFPPPTARPRPVAQDRHVIRRQQDVQDQSHVNGRVPTNRVWCRLVFGGVYVDFSTLCCSVTSLGLCRLLYSPPRRHNTRSRHAVRGPAVDDLEVESLVAGNQRGLTSPPELCPGSVLS